jgi:hypothetical protein
LGQSAKWSKQESGYRKPEREREPPGEPADFGFRNAECGLKPRSARKTRSEENNARPHIPPICNQQSAIPRPFASSALFAVKTATSPARRAACFSVRKMRQVFLKNIIDIRRRDKLKACLTLSPFSA